MASSALYISVVSAAALCCGICAALWLRERRKNKKLRALAAAGRYRPAIISHEIRTPLALITGAAELLAEGMAGELNARQKQFVRTITENSNQVVNIAENFLLGANPGKPLRIRRQLVDVREIVGTAARELRHTSDTPILVDCPGGILQIYADPQLLRQLVWNLINNALRHSAPPTAGICGGETRHTPKTSVTVRITAGENGGTHIIVSDTGTGIDPAEYDQIFAPFTTGSGRRPGTGIGMMVAKRITDAHGGRILIDSMPGKGTSFHVLLPRGEEDTEK